MCTASYHKDYMYKYELPSIDAMDTGIRHGDQKGMDLPVCVYTVENSHKIT